MGVMVSFQMRFSTLSVCAFLLCFPIATFSANYKASHVALPRMLLDAKRPPARPSCETNCTSHIEEEHGLHIGPLIIKATSPSPTSSCKQTYGVMPCTHSIIGGLFLLGTYGYIIFRAARLLVQGSELLLLVLEPGVIGGLILPIFGVLPDSILILVSGMGGSKAAAQDEILVGIGVLAGSNVMLLTLLWGTCLILGRCDLEKDSNGNLFAVNKKLSKRFGLCGIGAEIDKTTQLSAGIMCASIIPFLIVQLAHLSHVTKTNAIAVLIACLISLGGLLTYSIYQVMAPITKKKRMIRALHEVFFYKLLKYESKEGKLLCEDGKVDEDTLKRIFDHLDKNKDNQLTIDEVRAMLVVSYHNNKIMEAVLDNFMKDFDENKNDSISWEEFLNGMKIWCKDVKATRDFSLSDQKILNIMQEYQMEVQDIIKASMETTAQPTKSQLIIKAILFLVVGTLLISLFAQPLVNAVTNFSLASHIPSFFVSFVLLPLASNSSEAISSIIFASRKEIINMSLTYSQIYGGVTMNNTMSMGILLAIIYARGLTWEFSSEVLIICLVTLVMGVMALICRVFPLWIAGLVLLMYPFSIALVAILDHMVGWK